jgi:hypothetical protein
MPIKEEHIINRQNKRMVLYAGLLNEAHNLGLKAIDTDLIQIPGDDNGNVAIVKAVATMGDEREFHGIGDASPENVGRNIAPHLIRMAETRAKARALRDAINVAEALNDDESTAYEDEPPPQAGSVSRIPNRPRPVQQVPAEEEDPPEMGRRQGFDFAEHGPNARARKSQVDLLRTLAVEMRGENGVARLERRIGHVLADLTREEADDWIDRLAPAGPDGPEPEKAEMEEPEEEAAPPNPAQIKRYQWYHEQMGYPVPDEATIKRNYNERTIAEEILSLTDQHSRRKAEGSN